MNVDKIENKNNELVSEIPAYEKFTIIINVFLKKDIEHFVCAIGLCTNLNLPLRTLWSVPKDLKKGEHEICFYMNNVFLETGSYIINLGISTYERTLFSKENFNTLTISDISSDDKVIESLISVIAEITVWLSILIFIIII